MVNIFFFEFSFEFLIIICQKKQKQKSLAEIRIVKTIAVPELKSLGPLINTKDSVKAKNIFAIDDKTILIR